MWLVFHRAKLSRECLIVFARRSRFWLPGELFVLFWNRRKRRGAGLAQKKSGRAKEKPRQIRAGAKVFLSTQTVCGREEADFLPNDACGEASST